VVSYANSVKENVLGVSGKILSAIGPFNRETAEQMAAGVRALTGADAAVATTGIAGPGGTAEKPAGLVYIAASYRDKTVVTENHFAGTREEVREKAAVRALEMAIELIRNS
jgi:PncC family amidohydrolase